MSPDQHTATLERDQRFGDLMGEPHTPRHALDWGRKNWNIDETWHFQSTLVEGTYMADLGHVVDRFNAEVDRLRSLGLWPLNDREEIMEAAEPLIARFGSVGPEEQDLLRAKLSWTAKDVLLGFTSTLGSLALRLGSPDLVTKGLTALALVDEGNDYRDSFFALKYLHECATKLKMSPGVFVDAARFVKSAGFRRQFMEFARRRDTNH